MPETLFASNFVACNLIYLLVSFMWVFFARPVLASFTLKISLVHQCVLARLTFFVVTVCNFLGLIFVSYA